jgi:hypothetical protein
LYDFKRAAAGAANNLKIAETFDQIALRQMQQMCNALRLDKLGKKSFCDCSSVSRQGWL